MQKIYVYSTGKGPNPLNPETQNWRAEAIDENGEEEAEFYAGSLEGLKKIAGDYGRDLSRGLTTAPRHAVWVDNPDEYPPIIKIREGRQLDEDREVQSAREAQGMCDDDELEVMRDDHHLCQSCVHAAVCSVAMVPMFNTSRVTVAGCRSFLPVETEGPAPEPEPEPE